MRGSTYYQTGQLASSIYAESMSKAEQKETGLLANKDTIGTYREVWNQLGEFARNELNIKQFEKLEPEHIQQFMEAKLANNLSEQSAQVMSAAIGKLELAIERATGVEKDFSNRLEIISQARADGLISNPAKSEDYTRAYSDPREVVAQMKAEDNKLGAQIQMESGTRLETLTKGIKETITVKTDNLTRNGLSSLVSDSSALKTTVSQLQGIQADRYTGELKGQILTQEKGGKVGMIQVSPETYRAIEAKIQQEGKFAVNASSYRADMKQASQATNQTYNGSHGMRWNFAQTRFNELQEKGMSRSEAMQQVSHEMKHERSDITEHYQR